MTHNAFNTYSYDEFDSLQHLVPNDSRLIGTYVVLVLLLVITLVMGTYTFDSMFTMCYNLGAGRS